MTYNIGLDAFSKFRTCYGLLQTWPPSLSEIAHFIAYLSLNGLKYKTISTYVAAISFQCKISATSDTTKTFFINKVLEGLKRTVHKNDSRAPILPGTLSSIISALPSVCTSAYETSLFGAAFTIAFHGLLRVGELVFTHNANHALLISDVALGNSFITLRIRHSKTDQTGLGSVIQIPATGGPLCPFKHLSDYLKVRPNSPSHVYLFCHYDSSPLTRYQFSAVLNKTSNLVQFSGKLTSHSFRIGKASTLAMAGYAPDLIKQAGRWKSSAYATYIRTPPI